MNKSLNWNVCSNARVKRKDEERRKAELMAYHRSTATSESKPVRNVERDWANRVIFKSQRKQVEIKNRDSLADLMSSSCTFSSKTHVTSSRKKQSQTVKPLEINLTGPGVRTRNNASSWNTSSQIHQSGMRTHVATMGTDRRMSRGTVTSTHTHTRHRRIGAETFLRNSSFTVLILENATLEFLSGGCMSSSRLIFVFIGSERG